MKILIHTSRFSPAIGGTETATRVLAQGLEAFGNEVKVATDTEGPELINEGYELHRRPSNLSFLGLMKWCDVFVQSDFSSSPGWPMFMCRRPWVIIHHTIEAWANSGMMAGWMKKRAQSAVHLAVTPFVAGKLPFPSVVVGNPYGDAVFRVSDTGIREIEFIVVARLVEEKGVQVAIEALSRLHQRGYATARLTIVGEGPYRETLVDLVKARQLTDLVTFFETQPPDDLAALLNQHQILIIPSVVAEDSCMVAIEGIACGCFAAASDGGSLKELVGRCGMTFPAGNVDALANFLQIHLDRPQARQPYLQAAPAHLKPFTPVQITPVYIEQFLKAVTAEKK